MLVPGMQLGKYQLLKRLAVGGMAEIYLARASGIEGFEKYVVLKRILPQHAANDDFIRMFLDEARLAATLHHQNIAQTYDIGTDGGSYFFTMEYVHGEDMRNILKTCARTRKGLPLDHSITMVLGTAAGLHNAHEKLAPNGTPLNIVHRDVSPSNVLVTYDGAVKVVDFGIAKAATHRAESRVGSLKGKIAYMSPEQCRGEKLDRRSDVFAIGILLYELTTGTRLFKGENEFAILSQIVNNDVPPPSTRRQGYPEGLESIVMRALKRNRDERYGTAQELQLELEGFARDQRLVVSSVALSAFMTELFGKKPEPWRDLVVQAQQNSGPTSRPRSEPSSDELPSPAPALRVTGAVEALTKVDGTRPAGAPGDGSLSGILLGESAVSARPRRRGLTGALVAGGVAVAVVATALLVRGRGGKGDGGERPATVVKPSVSAPGVMPLPSGVPSPSPAVVAAAADGGAVASPSASPSPSLAASPSASPSSVAAIKKPVGKKPVGKKPVGKKPDGKKPYDPNSAEPPP